MGISNNVDKEDDLYDDMIWLICENCGCVQLKNLIEQKILLID